jgi:ribosomal protein S19E (S16A)
VLGNAPVGKFANTLVFYSVLVIAVVGCNKSADSSQDTTQTSAVNNPGAPVVLRGAVQSVSPSQVALKVDTGVATVAIAQPFHLYARAASDLSHVTANSFIGVTTVKQPDGTERATEIHIFPEELRGLGEGSRMMTPRPNAAASRMTNGNVSQSRMTNGSVSQSRMSNGNVASANGSSLVVQYAGGSTNVTVPPNTPVTELKAVSKPLAVGDSVALVVKLAADGTLTSDKAISTKR